MKILHLTLKKQWFDLIASGEKKEEYRENKPYWQKRLIKQLRSNTGKYREFDIVRFRNGYAKNAPVIDVEFNGIREGIGRKEWGAPDDPVLIISLGKIL